MLSILLVDDEQIERDGIRRLLVKQGFSLEVSEAGNGEEALELLSQAPVDILMTDIKMPFMDGLELAKRARELDGEMKIIIFSAYGEFEYAQKAIMYHIFSYLLKPIEVDEFIAVFTQVVSQCLAEREQRDRELRLKQGYEKGVEYEKGKMLLDLLAGRYTGDTEPLWAGEPLGERRIQMVLADFGDRFFDRNGQRFFDALKAWVEEPFEYVNLNETQSVLFLLLAHDHRDADGRMESLRANIVSHFDSRVTLAVGEPVQDARQLKDEYDRMEALLDNQFFFRESMVFHTGRGQRISGRNNGELTEYMEPIYWHLEAKDYFGFRRGVSVFLRMLEDSPHHSAIYIKYLMIELVRRTLETVGREGQKELRTYVEDIFSSRDLTAIGEHVARAMELLPGTRETDCSENTKKVVKDILQLIEEHYMDDISLRWIAEKVYLTQAYVSHLFSREMGQTFVKYLTMIRLQKAAEQLRCTNLAIHHIGEKVGYANDSYFGKIFKNHYGVSPARYREING